MALAGLRGLATAGKPGLRHSIRGLPCVPVILGTVGIVLLPPALDMEKLSIGAPGLAGDPGLFSPPPSGVPLKPVEPTGISAPCPTSKTSSSPELGSPGLGMGGGRSGQAPAVGRGSTSSWAQLLALAQLPGGATACQAAPLSFGVTLARPARPPGPGNLALAVLSCVLAAQ